MLFVCEVIILKFKLGNYVYEILLVLGCYFGVFVKVG